MKKIISTSKKFKLSLIGLLTISVVAFGTVVLTPAQEEEEAESVAAPGGFPPVPSDEDLAAGKAVYFNKCVWCHGTTGAGDGPGADRLWPRPRSFNEGTFKIRTTGSGELPTKPDLIKTVTTGLPGSAMPPWGGILSSQQIDQVVGFVMKELVTDRSFWDEEFEEYNIITVGTPPEATAESIERGREVYIKKGKCVECHGEDGRGDGNKTQKDEWGFPIFPAQLNKCWNFRGSRGDPYNPANIFREVTTGLNGTPMPSFAEVLSDEQRWDVANFVISLCPKREIDPLSDHPTLRVVIDSDKVEGEISSDPDDEMWQNQPNAYIGLAGQIIHKPRNFVRLVDEIWVRSLYNENEIAYLFEWSDRIESVATQEDLAQVASFRETPPAGEPIALRKYPQFNDAVAVSFPTHWQDMTVPEKPRFIFGDKKHSVDTWKWEADGKVQVYTGNGAMKGELKLVAKASSELKVPHAEFKDGQWRVIMKRTLATEDAENETQFELGEYIPTVFFVWDGNNGDHGLKGSISTWYYTILKPPTPVEAYVYPFFAIIAVFGFETWFMRRLKHWKNK